MTEYLNEGPDYANWVPAGMVAGVAGATAALATGTVVAYKLGAPKIVQFGLGISTAFCGTFAIWCAVFTLMVRFAVRGSAVDGLYFYPKEVQERAFEIGLATREETARKRKVFMTEFYMVMHALLVAIIGVWNHVRDFGGAYLQALLFLEVMNWYDGIVIDRLWVGIRSTSRAFFAMAPS